MKRRELFLAGVTPAALIFGLLIGPASADTVYLRDSTVLKGKVIDQGKTILLKRKLGGVVIDKTRIDRIVRDASMVSGDASREDVIIQTGGQPLRGRVEISPNGEEVWIFKSGNKMAIPRDHVRKILWGGVEEKKEDKAEAIKRRIDKLIEKLNGTSEEREGSKKELVQLGVFAIPYIKERQKALGERHPAYPVLGEVLRYNGLKAVITSEIESKVDDIYRRLSSDSADERMQVIKAMVLDVPEEAAPVLLYVLRQDEEPAVRALCVSQLSLLRSFKELMEVLKTPKGDLRMAAAIALGEHGILAGVPVLIDALELNADEHRAVLEDPKADEEAKDQARDQFRRILALNRIADVKLRAFTGQEFGYTPGAPSEINDKALERWRAWWEKNGKDLIEQGYKLARGLDEENDDRKTALRLWDKGDKLQNELALVEKLDGQDRRDAFVKAAYFYKQALKVDPTFIKARLSLSYLYYTELDNAKQAIFELRRVLNQTSGPRLRMPRALAYFHLACIHRREGDFPEAERRYYDALKLNPEDLQVHLAIGDLYIDWSLVNARLRPDEKTLQASAKKDPEAAKKALEAARKLHTDRIRARLEKAQQTYKRGLDELFRQEQILREEADKLLGSSATDSKRSALLESLRSNIRALIERSAAFYFGIGRADAALGFERAAERNFAKATRLAPDNKQYKETAEFWKSVIEERNKRKGS